MSDVTSLYRQFNDAGILLYVGISINAFDRFRQHAKDKVWIDEVGSMTIERFSSRALALAAEAKAIVDERPKYNIAGNPLAQISKEIRPVQKREVNPFIKFNSKKITELQEDLLILIKFSNLNGDHEYMDYLTSLYHKATSAICDKIVA